MGGGGSKNEHRAGGTERKKFVHPKCLKKNLYYILKN
jgi:hypothetical protein